MRVAAKKWADDLIDLGRTNTLLYYKDTKTSTLDLTHSSPAALAGLLAGQNIRLNALIVDLAEHKSACARAQSLRKKIIAFDEEQGIDVGKLARGLVRVAPRDDRGSRSAPALRAPLLLQPVAVQARTAAETDFTLQTTDEVELNPVLLYALNREFGVDLDPSTFGEKAAGILAEIADPADQVSQAYELLAGAIHRSGLTAELENRVVLGIFNYDKLPMVEDLHEATELLASHDVITALAKFPPAVDALLAAAAVDPAVSSDDSPPSEEYLVFDADASQQAAISRALAGAHVLIDGPPGTGKSQTIANIIAGMAAWGRRVLFVAEKRAAIEAVTERLAEADLAHLVFDLHDKRINRRLIAQQLAESLDRAGSEPPTDVSQLHRHLAQLRGELIQHPAELHLIRHPWQLSYYQAQSEMLRLPAECASAVRLPDSILRILDQDTISDVESDLKAFVDKGGLRVRRGESAWSSCSLREPDQLRGVLLRLDALTGNDYQANRLELETLVNRVGLAPPATVAGWRDVLDLLNGVAATIEAFGEAIFTQDLDMLCFATGNRSWRKQHAGSGGFWQRRAAIKQFRRTARNSPQNRAALHETLVAGAQQGDRWRELSVGSSGPSAAAGLERAVRDHQQLRDNLAAIAACASIPDLDQHSAREVEATVSRLNADRDTLRQIPDINQLSDRLSSVGLTALLDDLARRDTDATASAETLRWVWLASLLDEFRMQSGHLRGFSGTQQTRIAAEYRDADIKHRETTAPRVRRKVARRLREVRDAHPQQSQLVRDQAARKRRHLPVRQLIEKAPDVMLAARPCWAMSPMIVSRMLPARQLFDMVIFDEASQVEPQDAVPSIMRGRQLVVAGDPKQLPPTPYFRRALAGALDPVDDDSADSDADLGIYESILDGLQGVIPHRSQLRWHYRSRDERLIAFSNSEIYGNNLTTFPSTATQAPLLLSVVNGIAPPGQGGSAPEEVCEVVHQVFKHAELHPDEGLGVITMGQRHADRIEMALRDERRGRPELDDFFSDERGPRLRFFVKSLENVQGDERDAIILSIGYAKTAAGTLPLRFGALTREDGYRRLNVAITRARRRQVVVSSFHPSELSPQRLQAAKHGGTELLRRYMEYVETSRIDRGPAAESVLLNGFECSVLDALRKADLPVWPQWGVAGYRIDFVVAHPTRPSEMILAVETDGERYHKAASTRDRDRLRQEHLERLGWRFHRLWSSDWLRDPQAETDKTIRAWRKAAEDADRGQEASARESAAPSVPSPASGYVAAHTRGPRPWIPSYPKISDYSHDQLISLCLWLLSDQRQLPRDERVVQAMAELGFRRRGSVITERLTQALDAAQSIFDRRDG